MKPEAIVKAIHKEWLTEMGAWWFMPVQTGYGVSGIPDILCCLQGRFVAIEIKAPGKKPSAFQKRQIATINEAGGIAFYSDNLDYTKEMLKAGGINVESLPVLRASFANG